jgi:hypothetical protein
MKTNINHRVPVFFFGICVIISGCFITQKASKPIYESEIISIEGKWVIHLKYYEGDSIHPAGYWVNETFFSQLPGDTITFSASILSNKIVARDCRLRDKKVNQLANKYFMPSFEIDRFLKNPVYLAHLNDPLNKEVYQIMNIKGQAVLYKDGFCKEAKVFNQGKNTDCPYRQNFRKPPYIILLKCDTLYNLTPWQINDLKLKDTKINKIDNQVCI